MTAFLERHWVAGAGFMAGALLLLAPILALSWPWPLLAIFLHSPGYMVHQVEEHTGDRFRAFTNARMFGGREGLTTFDVLWVNCGMVWGLNLAALHLAWFVAPGWALAAPFLMVVNAIGHIGASLRFRVYNPGLVTALVIFLPLGAATLLTVDASLAQRAVGLALAVACHVAIMLNSARRLASLPA